MSAFILRAPNEWIGFVHDIETVYMNGRVVHYAGRANREMTIPENIEERDLALFTVSRKDYVNEDGWPVLEFDDPEDLVYFKLKYI